METATFKTKINVNQKTRHGGTALYLAAQKGQLEIVKALLNLGADVNVLFANQYTPVYVAAEKGREKVIQLLAAETKADLNFPDKKGITPLIAAVQEGHANVVKALLETGRVDINKAIIATDCTALQISIKKRRTDITNLLQSYNLRNKKRVTPLIPAITNNKSLDYQSIAVSMNPPLFGENTLIYINRESFFKALERQENEKKSQIGSYPIPINTQKISLTHSD
jgi:ankyrin repeat protein